MLLKTAQIGEFTRIIGLVLHGTKDLSPLYLQISTRVGTNRPHINQYLHGGGTVGQTWIAHGGSSRARHKDLRVG